MPSTRTRRPGNRATAQEQAVTDVQTPDATNEAPAANGTKKNSAPIQLTVPLDLKSRIEEAAKAADKTSARFILENFVTYKFPDYTLPEAQARGGAARPTALFPKSLSPEQKKERFDAARTLLAALDNGDIDLAEIKRKLGLEA